MTDQITDQDRRDAREWAEDVAETFKYDDEVPRETRAAVNYILATVDVPTSTLAEELMDWSHKVFLDEGGKQTMRDYSARAEQIEQERDYWKDYALDRQREVERLTTERDAATVARKENVAADQQANTQGTLSGSLPDPADVPYGEAWLVEYHGDDLPALRRLDHPGDWYLVRKNGTGGHVRSQDITLVTRLVPAPRQITTREELDALPEKTVVRSRYGTIREKYDWNNDGKLVWIETGVDGTDRGGFPNLPATVLWTPEEAA